MAPVLAGWRLSHDLLFNSQLLNDCIKPLETSYARVFFLYFFFFLAEKKGEGDELLYL
jgi:hypothetical protein